MMRSRWTATGIVIATALAAAGFGCTSLLGNFTLSDVGDDGGGDGAIEDARQPIDAPRGDAPAADGPRSEGSTCSGTNHVCGGSCVANDVKACGPSCTACPSGGGTATCDGTTCGVMCDGSKGLTDCGGACVDTSSDKANCGGCDAPCTDKSALGVACTQARCLFTLAANLSSPFDVAVDGANVYFTNNGTEASTYSDGSAMSVPIGGGTIVTYGVDQGYAKGIGYDGANVYWTAYDDGNLLSCAIKGCTKPKTIASGLGGPGFLALGDGMLFWGQNTPEINSCPTTNCTAGLNGVVGSPTALSPAGIAYYAGSIYWANSIGKGSGGSNAAIGSDKLGIGYTQVVASGQSGPNFLRMDGTNVYWTDLKGGTVEQIAPDADANAAITLASGQTKPAGLAVDGSNVYFATFDGNVISVPIGGGKLTTLATGQAQPQGMAVDAKNLYWANSDSASGGKSGAIMQLVLVK